MSDALMVAIVAAVPSTLAAIGAWRNGKQLTQVHTAVNGNLSKALAEIETLKSEVLHLRGIWEK